MSVNYDKRITLKPVEKNIIVNGEWLADEHVDYFNQLLTSCSNYKPVGTCVLKVLDEISAVSEGTKHIQILHSSSHFVCSYYDRKHIFIYDSLNNETLHKEHKEVLKRLFPTYDFVKNPVKFPTVQRQPNNNDCGVYAIAFAVSLLFNIKPDKVTYEHSLMRSHLLTMLETNVIEHFPQDLQNGVPQKVLPLAIIIAREADSSRSRIKYQCKKKESQKSNEEKISKSQQAKKELNNDVLPSTSKGYLQSIMSDIYNEQNNQSLNKSCFENIDCEINTNHDLFNNKEISNVEIYDTNKDVEKKCINKHPEYYKKNSEVKHINKEKRQREMTLSMEQKGVIAQGGWLNDLHMDHFNYLLEKYSDYKPVGTCQAQTINRIQPIPSNKKHIQILPSVALGTHWTCCYYDKKYIYIYDSLNTKILSDCQKQFLEKLFPGYDFIKNPVKFPVVQDQQNFCDCGVFAIAFAVSLLFEIKPDKVTYEHRLMRSHLLKMFETNVIEHFPQDLQYGVHQKVLPLAVIIAREANAIRLRIKRKCEYDQLQTSKKQKVCNSQPTEKELNTQNLERCAKKRHRDHQDIKNNRAKKRCQYKKTAVKQREQNQIRYFLNFEHEQERLRELPSDRQWLYNKRHYQKKTSESKVAEKNYNTAKNINKKYAKFRSTKSIKIRGSFDTYVNNILLKEDVTDSSKRFIEKRLRAEQIVRRCFHIRDNYVRNMCKILIKLKNRSETCLTVAAECTTLGDKLSAFCGISRHTASSENYFADSMYHDITSSKVNVTEPLMFNTRGQIVNALPLTEGRAKKSWSCSTLCKLDDPLLIDRYQNLLEAINKCTLRKIPELIKKINECTVTIFDKNLRNAKKGHAHSCYNNLNLCKAMSIPMHLLSPHFPKVRNIRRMIYELYSFYGKMLQLDEALTGGELDKLKEIISSAQEKADIYKHQQTDTIMSDDEICSKYRNAFAAMKKRLLQDIPRNICVSCERFRSKRNVSEFSKLQKTCRSNPIWNDLMAYVEQKKINPQYICHCCEKKFRTGLLPRYCILNKLIANDVPEEISSLNEMGKIFIQIGKPFQTVVRMGTVFNKKVPERQKIQKVKGSTFHLPLPLQETFDKLCSKTDPINLNHEVRILVRNIPTKSKIIWEDIVDIKQIYQALKWLKSNNFLYSAIVLPDTHDKLNLGNVNNAVFYIQETESDAEAAINGDCELLNNSNLQVQEMTDCVEVPLQQRKAMLTQKDESDSFYEQFTVYPLYEKKENKTATALYQMLKIQDERLDNREKYLDLMCFPDLYPFGSNGQYDEERPVKIQEHEFVKCRLTSKYPRFRLNIQYIFYLLNMANIRQIRRGIYHKMNITDPRSRYTAAEYLQAMSKELLESNLNTIFSSLRNTEQYWRRPRNDLDCMAGHYGPATWFITLSPSEWLWDDLGQYIREVNGWQDSSLSTSVLVAKDPVSTSIFLDVKFKGMLDFICSKDHPIGEVTHYFWRREYQSRGIQHFHLLIWIKDAPIFGESSVEEVSKFISRYISCKLPDKTISPLLYKRVVTHQRHRHNDYCLRSKKVGRKVIRRCRFGFPRPVSETLHMRDVATSIAGRKQLKHKSRLYDLPRTEDEVDINDYNAVLLSAWEGNMDIQYIPDISSILTWYVTKYTTKSAKGELSDFNFEKYMNDKSKSLASVLWNFGLRSLTNRECGALEAADTLLSISLYGTDRDTTIKWLNVSRIRQRKLKSRKEIEALDDESTDIFCASLVDDYYPNRPEELESVSLFEVAQWYDITTIEPRSKNIQYYKIDSGHFLKRRRRACLINHYKYNVETQPEDYFFSLLLMFKPWRNLEDLRDSCDTYAQAFEKAKLHLTEAVRYHEKVQELQKAYENAKQFVEQIDKQLQEKNVSQDDPDNPIGVQNIEAGEAMQDFKDLGEKIDEKIDVSEMIANLNADQNRVFDRVIDTVRSENSILRLYVSGEGGTGKSFLIKTIKCWIKQNLNKDTALAAPTGIAAFNIDGLTVHRLLQLPVEHGQTPKYKPLSDHVLKVLRTELKDVVLFVIDEVSMISNLTLMYIHLRLTEIFDTTEAEDGWFGRKHILLFGDLLQLPPVREDSVFMQLSNDKMNTCVGSLTAVNLWTTLFHYDELTINMRQQEDDTYRQLLSRIRIGSLTISDRIILESRKISFKGDSLESRLKELCDFINNCSSDTVCLLPTRHMCDALNTAMLSRIASKEILLIAEDTIDCTSYIRKKVSKVLANNDDDNSKTAGLSKEIVIKIGAKVMIRRNIDATLGLVNGTIATVVSVARDISTDCVEKIKLLLPSGSEYFIERVSVKFQVIDKAFVVRKQFPLCLSYGITIHKSQGLSLQSAVMDIGNSIFNCGQAYVALSRVTSLAGLHLINFDPSSVTADGKAINEYNRLRYKYKPEVETISLQTERHPKVKDIPWTLSKVVASVQENAQNQTIQENTTWVLRGFQNTDNVSCYANAVIQCLLHLGVIRKQLFNCDKSNVLRMLMHRYEYGMSNLNTHDVRQYLEESFSINVKLDALEFLTILCTNYDCIKQSVEHQVTSTIRCISCNITKTISYNNLVISISINNLKKKSYNLNDLLNVTFSHWYQSDNGSCEHCAGNDRLFKNELTLTNDIIIIHLALFSSQEGKVVKAIRNFNISSISTTKVLIAGQSYKVRNAIFHSGLCIKEGHYTSICREESSNSWIEIDDAQIKKRQWPRGAKDLYILFLQKVGRK